MMEDKKDLFIDDRDNFDEFMATHTPKQIEQMYNEMREKFNLKEIKPKSEEE